MIINLLLLFSSMTFVFNEFFSSMLLTTLTFLLLMMFILKSISMESSQLIKLSEWFMGDEIVFWLLVITLVVLITSIFIHSSSYSFKSFSYFSITGLLISSVVMFMSSDLLMMYIAYEFSLIPIVYVIMKWGHYSDRSLSAFYMLLYTTVFSFPFIIFVVFYYSLVGSFSTTFSLLTPPFWLLCLMSLSFLVKLPMYGLHSWLPLAHVEAPTFGSMILAGILLKLGGFGLYRLVNVLSFEDQHLFSEYLWAYVLVGMLISSLIASAQSDFKCLVAYSSVVHMTFFILVVLSQNMLSQKALLLLMVLHGVLSPALFLLVGLVYSMFATRLLLLLSGVYLLCPVVIALLSTLMFMMNIPIPPTPQFLTEVMAFMSCSLYSSVIYIFLALYVFMGLVYNLVWFIPTTVTPSPLPSLSTFSFFYLVVLLYYIMYIFMILFFMGLF